MTTRAARREFTLTPTNVLMALAGAVPLALAAGFAWFVAIAERPAAAPDHADGIVVLTGGGDRVETGLHLLASGRADRLLVSGVARGSDLASLARLAGIDPVPLAARVTLGHAASSTRGNAVESAVWARQNDVHSLIVVTGFYHMPRAMAELSGTLPDVALYRMPVVPPILRNDHMASLRRLAVEYLKYLAMEAGLFRLLPPDPGQRPIGATP
jgi:uncharacterized SAM-binding protein YcdF (DUF218 family)